MQFDLRLDFQILKPEPGHEIGVARSTMHFVPLGEQQLGQIRAVLTTDAANQSFHVGTLPCGHGPATGRHITEAAVVLLVAELHLDCLDH